MDFVSRGHRRVAAIGKIILGVTVSYQHSFTTVTSTDHFDGLELTNYGLALTGGIKYIL